MDYQDDLPSQADHANLASNNGQDRSIMLRIALVVLVVSALALALVIGVMALMTEDGDYLKKSFLMAVAFITEMKTAEYAENLFEALIFAKDMDELMKWLAHRVLPFVRRVAQR